MGDISRKIMIVDDNLASLTAGRNLLKLFYEVYPAQSAEMMFTMLKKIMPDLILLDIEMPYIDGYEAIRRLKADERLSEIPVIFLTTKDDDGSELLGFNLGAADYISKPFSPPLLRKRIENQMLILKQKETIREHADNLVDLVTEKTRDIFCLQNAVLTTVSDLVELRDKMTGGHIMRTQLLMEALLRKMIEKSVYTDIVVNWNLDFILPSAQLHDLGKVAISDVILNKPAKLTKKEFEIIKSHVTVGVDAVKRIIKNTPGHIFFHHALNIVGGHHEKWDGSGYTAGLRGEEIPLEGRLMAIVDVYDALTSWRPYKNPFSHSTAVQIIKEGSGTHFDPALVDVFLSAEKDFAHIRVKNNPVTK